MLRFLTLLFIFLISINYKQEEINKTYNIGVVQLTLPNDFKFLQEQGIDSYVAYLINAKNDTLFLEYGSKKIIYDIPSFLPTIFASKEKELFIKRTGKIPSSDEALFSDYPKEDEEERIFDKNYYMYDTINGIVSKIIQPKRIGQGITGIFIPKLKDGNSLSIYATNLDSASNRNGLSIFRKIKYK